MRFLYQRSVIHQIKPLRDIPFARFRNAPIFDTMQEWSKWGREHVSLDTLVKSPQHPVAERKPRRLESLSVLSRREIAGDLSSTANGMSIRCDRFTGG